MAAADAVSLQSVRCSYSHGPDILRIKRFSIAGGESVFLHGASGSGKTTLLSLLSGVLLPHSGVVQVLGNDMMKLRASARDKLRGERMGYIFQGFNLIPYLSVEENILLPCRLHARRAACVVATSLRAEAARLAQRLEIHAQFGTPVTQLSVGQQQRVAIARAVIGSPELLIADEPTSSLDADRRDAFLNLLMEVVAEARNAGSPASLLFVSHDRTLASHFDRTVSLSDINAVAPGSVAA